MQIKKITWFGLAGFLLACQLTTMPESSPVSVPSDFGPVEAVTGSTLEPAEAVPARPSEDYDLEKAFKAFYNSQISKEGQNCRRWLKVPIERDVQVRKTLLKKQKVQTESGAHGFVITLNETDDLKRRLLFNVRQGEIPVQSLKVNVNGQEVKSFFPENSLLRSDVPDMVLDLCAYMQKGENTLTVTTEGIDGSSAEVFMDGFLLYWDLPKSWYASSYSDVDFVQPVNIKFLEKLKVRLSDNVPFKEENLVDITGISLYPLHLLIRFYSIDKLARTYYKRTYSELDAEEQESEKEEPKYDFPNYGLFYALFIPETENNADNRERLAEIGKLLGKLPFVEDIFFEPSTVGFELHDSFY